MEQPSPAPPDLRQRLEMLTAELRRLDAVRSELDSEIYARIMEIEAAREAPSAIQTAALALPDRPTVPVESSITPDAIVCLADGVRRQRLTGYLRSKYGVTPDQYRQHYGLPPDYPMTAPEYARSAQVRLAEVMGRKREGSFFSGKRRVTRGG